MPGQQISGGQGSFGLGDRTVALSGSAVTCSAGEVIYHPEGGGDPGEEALFGKEITTGQGTLTFSTRHGQLITTGQGSLTPGSPPPSLDGFQISVGQGTVSASGNAVTVHISGSEIGFSHGVIGVGPTALSGEELEAESGTVGLTSDVPLVGSEVVVGQGTFVPGIDADDTSITSNSGSVTQSASVPLVGTEVTCSQESFSTDGKDLSGIEVACESGTVIPGISKAAIGTEIASAQESVGAPGGASLTGVAVTVSSGTLSRSPTLSGQEITAETGTIVGLPGVVALVGQSVSVEQGTIRSTGTNWSEEPGPTTTWTPTSNPQSAWVRKGGPSTGWNRKT